MSNGNLKRMKERSRSSGNKDKRQGSAGGIVNRLPLAASFRRFLTLIISDGRRVSSNETYFLTRFLLHLWSRLGGRSGYDGWKKRHDMAHMTRCRRGLFGLAEEPNERLRITTSSPVESRLHFEVKCKCVRAIRPKMRNCDGRAR